MVQGRVTGHACPERPVVSAAEGSDESRFATNTPLRSLPFHPPPHSSITAPPIPLILSLSKISNVIHHTFCQTKSVFLSLFEFCTSIRNTDHARHNTNDDSHLTLLLHRPHLDPLSSILLPPPLSPPTPWRGIFFYPKYPIDEISPPARGKSKEFDVTKNSTLISPTPLLILPPLCSLPNPVESFSIQNILL